MLTEQLEEELSLLKRHLDVLNSVEEEGPIGIRRLAEETGQTKSKVRYSLRVLEKEGYIEPSKRGATASGKKLDDVKTGLRQVHDDLEDILNRL